MRVLVLRTQIPFVHGGAERHADGLVDALRAHGHEAEVVALPFKSYPPEQLADQMHAAKLLDLERFEGAPVDLAIGLKFPAWLARHPSKSFWVLHQHRQAFDMWDGGTSDLTDDPAGPVMREAIRAEDRAAMEGRPIYANSRNVAARLARYVGIEAEPLYHPPPNADRLRAGPYGDYLLLPGRVARMKRHDLVLEALAASSSRPRLVVIGAPDDDAWMQALRDKARDLGIGNRVEWRGTVSDDALVRAYAEARGVVFAPVDEDYGYVTLESMIAARPVITTTDSGGPLEFVTHGQQGLVAAPEAGALAARIDRLMEDRDAAERMGAAGRALWDELGIGWPRVVETLTGQPARPSARPEPRPEAPQPPPPDPGTPEEAAASLAAAIAPRQPVRAPFGDIEELLAAYELGTLPAGKDDGGLASYFRTHWQRYLSTLAHVEDAPPGRVLDVGVFPPFIFQALLAARFPGIRMDGVWEGPQPFAQTVRGLGEAPGFTIELGPANVETDPLPVDAGAYDLVLGMEIFEHFAIDPLHFLAEAWRALRPGGRIVVTPPNVVSHRGVEKALQARAPYSFGIFVPTGGVYGRHNREWAPSELARIGEAAGFETAALVTADLYDRGVDPGTAHLLASRGDDPAMRGENLTWIGRKPEDAAGEPAPALPEGFYHGDPRAMAGRLRVLGRDPATGRARIEVANRSRLAWAEEGQWAMALRLDWTDASGRLVHPEAYWPLDGRLEPGASAEVGLPLGTSPDGTVGVEIAQLGVGAIRGAGRANRIELPCSERAFRALAEAGRR